MGELVLLGLVLKAIKVAKLHFDGKRVVHNVENEHYKVLCATTVEVEKTTRVGPTRHRSYIRRVINHYSSKRKRIFAAVLHKKKNEILYVFLKARLEQIDDCVSESAIFQNAKVDTGFVAKRGYRLTSNKTVTILKTTDLAPKEFIFRAHTMRLFYNEEYSVTLTEDLGNHCVQNALTVVQSWVDQEKSAKINEKLKKKRKKSTTATSKDAVSISVKKAKSSQADETQTSPKKTSKTSKKTCNKSGSKQNSPKKTSKKSTSSSNNASPAKKKTVKDR